MVSVIIPTYNRAELIGATLDSILAQTFKDWECIIVDDGSTDYTEELLEFYCGRDCRVKYVKRPEGTRKGANTCRNYGFEISSGEYIQWFDSDDLMLPSFLEEKVNVLDNNNVDYVISKAFNFRDPDTTDVINKNEYHYKFENYRLTHYNYLVQNINWLTYDFMCRRSLVESLRFNDNLRSAQERNFFTRLTCYSENAFLLDRYLTKRRIHDFSIQTRLKKNEALMLGHELEFFYHTWLDFKKMDRCKESQNILFVEAVKRSFFTEPSFKVLKNLTAGFLTNGEIQSGAWYFLYQLSMKIFGRGIFFRDRFREVSPILNQKKCA
ncbi:glycosyltransferase family 2 protein [Salinimicrobium gaetbulicola]|uniref:Glycosyltransferase family 2 protein n=1 Tax=Salinimicrobium gaetbulicola TaxID=999702 RepID=A0ABW3IIM5_9FLAO